MTRKRDGGLSFEIEVARLNAALKDVVGVVEARNTVPVLSNVLLAVSPTALVITGTDLDVQVERHLTLPAIAETFAITVEAATFKRITDKLPGEAMALIRFAEGKLSISAGRSRFALPTLPADDMPVMQIRDDAAAEFEMQAIYLNGAIGALQHAISTEETRFYLNGIFIHAPDTGDLRMATTDGHRLARAVLPRPDGAETLPDAILPRKVVKLLSALLDRHEGSIGIAVTSRMVRFEVGETTLVGKLIDGQFPDYTRVIPDGDGRRLAIDRAELMAAVGRVATVGGSSVWRSSSLPAGDGRWPGHACCVGWASRMGPTA